MRFGPLIARVSRWLPRAYVRVDYSGGGYFIGTLREALAVIHDEVSASDARHVEKPQLFPAGEVCVGDFTLSTVWMTPRRFEALPEFQGF